MGPEDRQGRHVRQGGRRPERLHAGERRLRLFHADAQCRRLGRSDPSSAIDPEDQPFRQGRDPGHRGGWREVRRAQRSGVRARRSPLFHRLRRLGASHEAASWSHRRRREGMARRTCSRSFEHVYPNGIVVEPDGSIVWVESYTLECRAAQARRLEAGHLYRCRRGTFPTA